MKTYTVRTPVLLLVFIYAVLGVGLIGCGGNETETEIIDPDPDYIRTDVHYVTTVVEDEIVATHFEVQVGFQVHPRWGCIIEPEESAGCMGFGTSSTTETETVFDFSGHDYSLLRTATVMVNDIQFEFSELDSDLDGDDFTVDYAAYRLPASHTWVPQPGDSITWTVQVENDSIYSEQTGGELIVNGPFQSPELPENRTIVQPGDSLGMRAPYEGVGRYELYLYRDSELTDFVGYHRYNWSSGDVNFYGWEYLKVPSNVTTDTLWLQARQSNYERGGPNVYYQWLRTILVE